MTTVIILAGKNMLDYMSEVEKFISGTKGRILVVVGKNDIQMIETVIQDCLEPALASKITCIVQHAPKGTGHAAMCCLSQLKPSDQIIILTRCVSAEMMRMMNPVAKNSIRIMTMRLDNPAGHGRVVKDIENGNVKIIEDELCDDREKTVNCGIYSMMGEMLMMRLPFLTISREKNTYNLSDIVNGVRVEMCEVYEMNMESNVIKNVRDDDTPF
jgi:bifunctional UDP-N-acetylglucosamine pyrophosphorylase/glucosamine-1-phosphate N-acetyltransferase